MKGGLSYIGFGIVRPLLAFAGILAAWEAFVTVREIPQILLPKPTAIAAEAWAERLRLLDYTWNTSKEALLGLGTALLLATIVCVAVYASDLASSLVSAVAGAGRAIPAVVLFPIVTVFLGTSDLAVQVVVTIALMPYFVVYILNGLRQRTPLDDLMHVIAGTRMQKFRSVRLPLSFPYLMTGIRTCLPIAIITAIVSEYFGGPQTTLGAYIQIKSQMLHAVEVWSAITYACLLGLGAFAVGLLLERFVQNRSGVVMPSSS